MAYPKSLLEEKRARAEGPAAVERLIARRAAQGRSVGKRTLASRAQRNAAQVAQDSQVKALADVGAILNATGADVRGKEAKQFSLKDAGATNYDMEVADRYSEISTGLNLEENRLLNAVARHVSLPNAAQDEELIGANILLGHQQIEREQQQYEANVHNAAHR